tara:strand:- start:4126 stop:5457 length:1332 start_codon:yes stop_codon:yes gene_type:complete
MINHSKNLNIIFAFFPVSFILGNFFTNFNLILFSVYGILYLKSKIFKIKFDFSLKIIFLFFLFVFLSTVLSFLKSSFFQEQDDMALTRLIKSALFFRFFLLLLILYVLNELDIIDYKYFFVSAAIFSVLISADLVFQYIFGFNIIGLESYVHHNTSFFGDELIAGGYVQNFAFFSIFFFIYKFGNSENFFKYILISFLIALLSLAIMISGNRMPVILFLLGIFLIYVFNKKLKKIALINVLIFFTVLGTLISNDNYWKISYKSFFQNIYSTVTYLYERTKADKTETLSKERQLLKDDKVELAGYSIIFSTALETWKLHKVFGNGIKSFRVDCAKIIRIQKRGTCSNHPHNYYIEILSDLGIVGFVIVLIIASMFLFFLYKNYKFFEKNNLQSLFLLAATISLFLEVFPLKSTGSIFTTNNATYIVLLGGIILSYKKLLKDKAF